MNKKVLIISSTPRKGGNSDILCDAFAEGAREAGNEVEKVRIADLKIGYCTGCYEGSEECGMVCADGVYEKGTVAGTKFVAEAKELGLSDL